MLETVLLEDTSMRNVTPNVFFEQISTLDRCYVLGLYNIKRCRSIVS